MPLDIQREIAALPELRFASDEVLPSDNTAAPLDIIARQGRLIMRLSAASESLDRRFEELSRAVAERGDEATRLQNAHGEAERRLRQTALTAIHLMDVLDRVHDSLSRKGLDAEAREVETAQRDCLRRLAGVGITEIPCSGVLDGRLHEGVETVESADVPRYHIVRVEQRGFQCGTDVLRPAKVTTAR